ncbi:hypothetical protein K437DRAFT_292311 [Tilletiaria anomala UBC 951]|uniref:RING-type E3 ubiquitin transferase n=1 Tax=Tilletiaria anomala (strain ATCC 24038 / CBS 436.72 / UBC 951) TaxID=1037660 RepID=A0A066WHW5_TILAU|nr:uncharacterized protein K437DRAFT_292311 [Tilletiaria anomala UBC 951]KDN53376.1 hypothetical protein K437DRAFT_292311 [Tilletiaria anomala UBC 951]
MDVAADAEGETCRICRSGPEPDALLYHPCKCTGSIRSCHQACLIEWLQHSKKKYCELCNHSYVFHKRYKASMPAGHLPWRHYLRRLFFRTLQVLRYLLRAVLCALSWLVVLPLVNIFTLRGLLWTSDGILWGINAGPAPDAMAWFIVNSNTTKDAAAQAPAVSPAVEDDQAKVQGQALFEALFQEHKGLVNGLIKDCFEGQILSCIIVVLFVGVFLLREWVLQHLPQAPEPAGEPDHAPVAAPANPLARQNVARVDPHAQPALATPLDNIGERREALEDTPEQVRTALGARELKGQGGATGDDNHAGGPTWPPTSSSVVDETGSLQVSNPNLPQNGPGEGPGLDDMRRRRFQALGLAPLDPEEQNFANRSESLPGPSNRSEEEAFILDRRDSVTEEHLLDNLQLDSMGTLADADDAMSSHSSDEENDAWEDVTSDEEGAQFAVPRILQRRILNIDGPDGLQVANEVPINGANEDGHPDELMGDDLDPWEEADAQQAWEDEVMGVFETVGLHGPLSALWQNLALITVLSSFALLVFAAVPFIIGRLFGTGERLIWLVKLPIRGLRIITDPLFDGLIALLSKSLSQLIGTMVGPNPNQAAQSSIVSQVKSNAGHAKESFTWLPRHSVIAAQKVANSSASWMSSRFWNLHAWVNGRIYGKRMVDRATAVAVGHLYWILALMAQQRASRYFNSSIFSWAQSFIDEQLVIVKVGFFIGIELAAFPLGCGFILDLCALPLCMGITIADRISSLCAAPLTFLFVHWVVGTLYMFLFAQFVSLTRDIARPGVLCWIRDPHDLNFQPVKEILDRKSTTHMAKLGTSVLMYTAVLIGTVGFPSVALRFWASFILPLRTSAREHTTYSLLDLVAILIVVPWLIRKAKPSRLTRRLYSRWWKYAAAQLRLSSFLRGGRHRDEEGVPLSAQEGSQASNENSVILVGSRPPTGSFARVPADNHAIMSTPLVIRTDASGMPFDERGRQAIKVQHAAISKMTGTKPKYTIVYVPPQFRVRLWAFVASLGLSAALLITLCMVIPLLLGRTFSARFLSDREPHDGRAYFIGACLSLAILAAARGVSKLVRGEQPKEDADGVQIIAIKYDTPLWRRLAEPFCRWLCHVAVVRLTMPLLFGLNFQQYVEVPVLFGLEHPAPTISLIQAWEVGTMVQKIVLYSVTDAQYDAWKDQEIPFLSLVGRLAIALILPPVLTVLGLYGARIDIPRANGQAYLRHSYIAAAAVATCSIFGSILFEHMKGWTDSLKDELYLEQTELLNYEKQDESTGVKASEYENTGPIPDALLAGQRPADPM